MSFLPPLAGQQETSGENVHTQNLNVCPIQPLWLTSGSLQQVIKNKLFLVLPLCFSCPKREFGPAVTVVRGRLGSLWHSKAQGLPADSFPEWGFLAGQMLALLDASLWRGSALSGV